MSGRYGVAVFFAGIFLLLGIFFIPSRAVFAGEQWRDNMGITVNAANRNADRIRRSQNREERKAYDPGVTTVEVGCE